MWFLLGLFIICIVVFIVWYWILTNNNLYCMFYQKEERKRWEQFVDMASDFYCIQSEPTEYTFKVFRSKDYKYEAVIWESGLCSIHTYDEECTCLASTFDQTMSKKMAELLMKQRV